MPILNVFYKYVNNKIVGSLVLFHKPTDAKNQALAIHLYTTESKVQAGFCSRSPFTANRGGPDELIIASEWDQSNISASARNFPLESLSERTGAPPWVGHRMPIEGSLHRIVRSHSGA